MMTVTEMTVNDVIARAPDAVRVFGRLGIDACCGGGLPVEEACRRHGLELDAVKAELEALLAEAAAEV